MSENDWRPEGEREAENAERAKQQYVDVHAALNAEMVSRGARVQARIMAEQALRNYEAAVRMQVLNIAASFMRDVVELDDCYNQAGREEDLAVFARRSLQAAKILVNEWKKACPPPEAPQGFDSAVLL